jgi:Fanconi anemia group M protein
MIVVDSNEAAEAPTIAEILRTGAEVAVRQLEAGDYLLTGQFGSVLVERKRVPDFLSSLKGRLWDQLERIRSFEGTKVLILEGNVGFYRRTGWNETAVLAMIDKIAVELGIPIVPTPDERGTAAYLLWKHKRLGEVREPREYPLRVARREMTPEERALYTLEGMCGHKTAMALLEHFGTLGDLICFVRSNPYPVVESRLSAVKVGGRSMPESTVRTIYATVNAAYRRVGER